MQITHNSHVLLCVKNILHHFLVLIQQLSNGNDKHGHEVVREEVRGKVGLYSHGRHLVAWPDTSYIDY